MFRNFSYFEKFSFYEDPREYLCNDISNLTFDNGKKNLYYKQVILIYLIKKNCDYLNFNFNLKFTFGILNQYFTKLQVLGSSNMLIFQCIYCENRENTL